MTYNQLTDAEDYHACKVIIRSIEMRWAKADQEVFIAAVILNPFIKTTPFSTLPFLTVGGIHVMLQRLWSRFFPDIMAPDELSDQITDYLDGTGIFQHLASLIDVETKRADSKVCHAHFNSVERITEWHD